MSAEPLFAIHPIGAVDRFANPVGVKNDAVSRQQFEAGGRILLSRRRHAENQAVLIQLEQSNRCRVVRPSTGEIGGCGSTKPVSQRDRDKDNPP